MRLVGAAAVVVTALAVTLVGCDGTGDDRQPTTGGATGATTTGGATGGAESGGGCAAPLIGPLPVWARAGFSGDASAVHVLGERGDIAAVLFGHPLRHPPGPDRSNKILWVSRVDVVPGDPFVIEGRLDGTGQTARVEVPNGPGPSIIDLPGAGCWRLDLAWSEHRDTVWLTYQPGPSPSPT